MVLLVFVHGYNLTPRYLAPWTTPMDSLSLTSFVEYYLANGLLRFRIPMLFVISGYLYALYDQSPYKQRIKKRARTLLLPYFLWSGLFILIIYLAELIPVAKQAIMASQVLQIDQTRMTLHDYHWDELLSRWIFDPLPYQLWFLRVLFFYNLCYPLIRRWVLGKKSKWVFFSIALFLWLTSFPAMLFDGEGLLFFSLGVWLQKTNFDIDQPKKCLNPWYWGIACLAITAVKTWLAFKGFGLLGNYVYLLMSVLHKFVVLSGLIAAWFGFNGVVRWCMTRKWFVWLSAFSFMIYALHAPLVAIVIDPFYAILNYPYGYRMLTFILLPLTLIICSIVIGALLRKGLPKVYSVLTGGRGLH